MSGRPATTDRVAGQFALSIGLTDMPAPKGWRWVKLTDVARLESGHTPSRNRDNYWNGGIPWIGIKDARDHNGRRILDTLQKVTQAGIDNSAARLLPAGTVCLSRTASVGYSLVMGKEMATSQDFVNWMCSQDLHPEFLMHLFLAERESLLRFAKGTVHKTIYFPEAKALHVCIPAPDEQRRIVAAIESYFSRLDAASSTLERVQRNLERYRASVLKAAVEGRLVPTEAELAKKEGRSYEPASVLLKRILAERRRRWEEAELAKLKAKDKPPTDDRWKAKYEEPAAPDTSGLPALPEGWCWANLDQLAEVGTGLTPSRGSTGYWAGGTVPWVASRAVNERYVDRPSELVTELALRETRLRIYPAGTLLLAMYGEGLTRGKCAELRIPAAINQALAAICLMGAAESLRQWVHLFLSHHYAEIRKGSAGGVQPNLNLPLVRRIRVPLSPTAEQASSPLKKPLPAMR